MPSLRGIHLLGEKGDTDSNTHQERRNKCQRVGTSSAKTVRTLTHLCIENRNLCLWQSCGMTRYFPQSIGRKGLQTRFFPKELKQGRGGGGRGDALALELPLLCQGKFVELSRDENSGFTLSLTANSCPDTRQTPSLQSVK